MLYLIPTVLAPDTAKQVLPPQVLEVIAKTNYFFVENLRTTRRFISELKLGKAIDQLHFFVLDKDTSLATVREYFSQVPDNEDIGIVSEAGCPGIADPGALAVGVAHELGMGVMPLVGPSSILLALMASGFSGQCFAFHGYLPIEASERVKALKNLEKNRSHQTQIFMETPYRNNGLLMDILRNLDPKTKLSIAADITAPTAFLQTKTVEQWQQQVPDLHKRPTIFLLGI